MSVQATPSLDPSVFVASLSWALISAVMLANSIRTGGRTDAVVWTLSFVGASVIAAAFFWRLVWGGAS